MSLSKAIHGPFWLFDTSVFIPRFDVLESPTGIFTDLSWSLSDRYRLPLIAELTTDEEALALKAAWHEKGLFFECEFALEIERPVYLPNIPPTSVMFSINSRYAPGIQRANANCSALVCYLDRTHKALEQSNGNFKWTKIARAHEVSCDKIDTTFAPVQLNWLHGKQVRLKAFVGAPCLPSYNPIEFPEIAFSFMVQSKRYESISFANTYYNGSSDENPSKWCRAKLVEK